VTCAILSSGAFRVDDAFSLTSNEADSRDNDSGFLLRDHNADPGPRGASRVDRDPDANRVSSKP